MAENQVIGLREGGKRPLAVLNDLADQGLPDFVGGATNLGSFRHTGTSCGLVLKTCLRVKHGSFNDFLNREMLSFMTPPDHARLVEEEVLGSKFSTEVWMLFLKGDVNPVAVGAVTSNRGHAPNAVNEDGVRVRDFSGGERGGVVEESEVFFGSKDGLDAV